MPMCESRRRTAQTDQIMSGLAHAGEGGTAPDNTKEQYEF